MSNKPNYQQLSPNWEPIGITNHGNGKGLEYIEFTMAFDPKSPTFGGIKIISSDTLYEDVGILSNNGCTLHLASTVVNKLRELPEAIYFILVRVVSIYREPHAMKLGGTVQVFNSDNAEFQQRLKTWNTTGIVVVDSNPNTMEEQNE